MILLLLLVNLCSCEQQQNKLTDSNKSKVPYYNTPEFTPIWTNDRNIIDTLHVITKFNFIDQNGDTINNTTFKNKIYVADFFFTRCLSICPKMTATMKSVYENYKNNPQVSFLSHSVTPEIDSVPVLKKMHQAKEWTITNGILLPAIKMIFTPLRAKVILLSNSWGFPMIPRNFCIQKI
jgi:protein SCO1/2